MDVIATADLRTYQGEDRIVLSSEMWDLVKNYAPSIKGQTGLKRLDEAIGGFESEELIVISGPTAMGKTTLCQTIMKRIVADGKRPLFFSFEVSPHKIASDHRYESEAIYLPLKHQAMNISWLETRCWEAAIKYQDLGAIFVDHLHYVVDMASRLNMSLEIGQTMRFLKQRIAVALNLPVFLVAHMIKIPLDEEPSINHLRDSALIGCEADTVLVLWRQFDKGFDGKKLETMNQGLATVKIEKARRTGTMGRKISLCKVENKLIEVNE